MAWNFNFQKNSDGKKVLVALSGGVDSAVAAYLLKKEGYRVEAGHIVCWTQGPECSSDADRASAARVASYLNIPFRVFDFQKEYKKEVIDYFFSEYEVGRTPNPDVACNREIKFGIFLKKALEEGFDYIATGHYARVEKGQSSEQFRLLAGADPEKDQSYFLYTLTQEQLAHTLFPVGSFLKSQVRQIAKEVGLPNAEKKDSQGICFIGDVNVREFLAQKIPITIGKIINREGKVLGEHQGLAFYTIGQREGLGISSPVPHYVVAKETKTNSLIVAPFGDEAHFKKTLRAEKTNWVARAPEQNEKVEVRIRYRQPLTKARISSIDPESITIEFEEAQKAVTAGQALLVYQGEETLGGGVIT